LNLYGFARNNPLKYVDRFGHAGGTGGTGGIEDDADLEKEMIEGPDYAGGLDDSAEEAEYAREKAAEAEVKAEAAEQKAAAEAAQKAAEQSRTPESQNSNQNAPPSTVRCVAKTPLWTSTKSKSAVENAFGHWQKHGAEFPEFQNAKQYVEGAKDFFNKPPSETLTTTRPNGDTLFYNPANNTFGVQAADGAPRTMFRPTDGINYWNKQ
jgi:pyocin large subunit-like protein